MTDSFTWKDVPGHFSFGSFYDWVVDQAQPGAHFVEVGVFYGRSLIYLAQRAQHEGKSIIIDGIDSFNHPAFLSASEKMCRHFLDLTNTTNLITLTVMDQIAAAATYADNSLDMVLLDADHSFNGTLDGIQAFLPKVKSGGIIAGDDYDLSGFTHVVRAAQKGLPKVEVMDRVFFYRKP